MLESHYLNLAHAVVLKVQFTKKNGYLGRKYSAMYFKAIKNIGMWCLNPIESCACDSKVKYEYVGGYCMREMSLLLVDCKYTSWKYNNKVRNKLEYCRHIVLESHSILLLRKKRFNTIIVSTTSIMKR